MPGGWVPSIETYSDLVGELLQLPIVIQKAAIWSNSGYHNLYNMQFQAMTSWTDESFMVSKHCGDTELLILVSHLVHLNDLF